MPPIAEEMAGGTNTLQVQQPKKKKSSAAHRPRHSPTRDSEPHSLPPLQQQEQQQQPQTSFATSRPKAYSVASFGGETDDKVDEDDVSYTMMQVRNVKPKTSVVTTMDHYSTDPNLATEFFKKEPCVYSHRMFVRASKIFAGLKSAREAKLEKKRPTKGMVVAGGLGPKPSDVSIEPLDFKNSKEMRLTYELAFSSLKFENVFDDMLDDCAFFSIYPELRDDNCLVLVVLWDYQSRKFQPRIQFDADALEEEVTRIEQAILDQKTKLAASLARRRIKQSAPTIDYLLPNKLRNRPSAQKPLPLYAWVNTMKISPGELLQKLKEEKFVQLWIPPKTVKEFQDRSFYLDPHCSDVLAFSPDCNVLLQEHYLVDQAYLVRQDKSSCLAVHSVIHMLGDEQEVAVINPGAGLTTAHMAVLLKDRKCTVVVISEHAEDEYNKMMRNLELIGVTKYVKVFQESFVDIDPDDARLKGIRAALVTAECSKSAINNIVSYIVTEGENLKLLQDLSEQSDDMDDHLLNLQTNHIALLRQALKLSRIQGVTYLTRSMHHQENDAVVQRALEYVNMVQMPKKLRPWRLIPPVLPFSSEEIDEQVAIQGKHVFFKPSELMNGCFLVCIAREPEDPAEIAKARALTAKTSKGKLKSNGSSSESSEGAPRTRKKSSLKKGKASTSKVSTHSNGSTNGRPVTSRSSRLTSARVPEYAKVVKHPAPFR